MRAGGRSARAEADRRYLRSELEHLGATVPQVRSEVAHLLPRSAVRTAGELMAVVDALWARPVHETRLAAAVALQRHSRLLTADHLPALEALIGQART